MQFEIKGGRNGNNWGINASVPTGETVTAADVASVLIQAAAFYAAKGSERVLTVSEWAALCALPEGWAATNDAINIVVTDGVQSFTRNYVCDGGSAHPPIEKVAPCAPDGSPTPATRTALLG